MNYLELEVKDELRKQNQIGNGEKAHLPPCYYGSMFDT